MSRSRIVTGVFVTVLVLVVLGLAASRYLVQSGVVSPLAAEPAPVSSDDEVAPHPSLLHGRVTAVAGTVHEGRIRWGGDEEAFWSDVFNGTKAGNTWTGKLPSGVVPSEERPVSVLGFELARRERPLDLGRPFVARFGDLAKVEPAGSIVHVTLRSGTVVALDRHEASDFDDGVRIWSDGNGVVDLAPDDIRFVELVASPTGGAAPSRLHGTVTTSVGDFAGFFQWNRWERFGHDLLDGRSVDGAWHHLRFDTLRSLERHDDGLRVTMLDGRELVLSDHPDVGSGNRGVRLDDPRTGRVLIPWGLFERVDFSSGSSGPTRDDYPPGRALSGRVTTGDGRVLAGRLVYDLDESETTDTLDAPSRGVSHAIAFGRIASVVPSAGEVDGVPVASVVLRNGEELRLEHAGDLSAKNAGLLVFIEGQEQAEYLRWADVKRIDLDG
ncbi:MAG: hypothetical protein AAF533_10715 [Acidobacteriota bacterium]